ncbi:Protein of unknown function (DUF604) [Quillaja saponaria]|uniref:Uncharacterized protein n=1 Tax=Quillaja saponaria TaxID=32244 RepID=A0AAD7LTL5_QUISA|nr:Protein of unknown function (DUF604) [Quillaja saponaria]
MFFTMVSSIKSFFNLNSIQQKHSLLKSLVLLGLVLFMLYTLLFSHHYQPPNLLAIHKQKRPVSRSVTNSPTNLSDIMFGIVGSVKTWKHKRSYVESWWRPNVTRGYVFLDREPSQEFLPWSSNSPPFRVNRNITKSKLYPKIVNPIQIRIVHTILETFREGDKDVKWYVMADDDTVLFIDNLVEVLAKYDHTKYFYIGENSECIRSNSDFSFDMAFGGAGYALSYALMEVLATKLDGCIERYPHLHSSDFILHACLADLGVALTHEKGFHQIDLRGDISGLLSAHNSDRPLVSLHHIDIIDPIFSSKNRSESVTHLMKAYKLDHSRLLQQTICYHRPSNWSFSISWGYSTHIYETIFPQSFLQKPLETFRPWMKYAKPPFYIFNTRGISNNPCETPHEFFFDSMEISSEDQIVTTYVRISPRQRNRSRCFSTGNHSADSITRIQVFSPAATPKKVSPNPNSNSLLLV